MAKKAFFLMILAIMVLGSMACFNIRVQDDVDFPAARFSAAREAITNLERHNPDRVGQAKKMHLLVYDGDSRELVSGSFPMWLLKMTGNEEEGRRQGEPHELAARYIDFDHCPMRELSRLGPGLLVQVDDRGENTHVLIWLE